MVFGEERGIVIQETLKIPVPDAHVARQVEVARHVAFLQ
jgi:hypothetical protein